MAFQSVEFTPEEEDMLDEVLIELGYATAEDIAEARRVPLNLDDAEDPDLDGSMPDEDDDPIGPMNSNDTQDQA